MLLAVSGSVFQHLNHSIYIYIS